MSQRSSFRTTMPYVPPPRTSFVRWWIIALFVTLPCLCILSICFSSLLINGLRDSGNALSQPLATSVTQSTTVADDFLQALKAQQSRQAYGYLDVTTQVMLSSSGFDREARAADTCYGAITSYQIITEEAMADVEYITYLISRKNLSSPYRFPIVLVQETQANWAITSYGKDSNDTISPPGVSTCRTQ